MSNELREAAQAVLDVWDSTNNIDHTINGLTDVLPRLRKALATQSVTDSHQLAEPRAEAQIDDFDREAFKYIDEHPLVQSLLYDINLMPEQLEVGSRHWGYMHAVVQHFRIALEQTP